MNRRELIARIYKGICVGATVPFWPDLLVPKLQTTKYFPPGAYCNLEGPDNVENEDFQIHRWELGG